MAIISYDELNKYKVQVKSYCQDSKTCIDVLMTLYKKGLFDTVALQGLIERIKQDSFKVVVIGKFSTGKSSLINALLGNEVLPDSIDPCTAYINEVKYGAEEKATIYFKQPLPENCLEFVQNEGIRQHILAHKEGIVPEYTVALEELYDCVTIPFNEDEDDLELDSNHLDISPFEKAVIEYPCELCRNGIEIIDSPGLDESRFRTDIVEKYLKNVDAVIYVTTNIATGGDGDKEIINEYLVDNKIKNVFFVCNLFGIPLAKAKQQLVRRLNKIFAEKTLLGEQGIHVVNIGDTKNNGVEDFKAALTNYLNNDRGRAELTIYIEKIHEMVGEIIATVRAEDSLCDTELKEIEAQIAGVEGQVAAENTTLGQTKWLITETKQAVKGYGKRDLIERHKKLNYKAKVDVRDRNVGNKVLNNDSTEAEALELANWLAQEYLQNFRQGLQEYVVQRLAVEATEEIENKLKKLQEKLDGFQSVAKEKLSIGLELAKQAEVGQALAANVDEKLIDAVEEIVNISQEILDKVLQNSVKEVFEVYSTYQSSARGTKLTKEIQAKVSQELATVLEGKRREVAGDSIDLLQAGLEELVFGKAIAVMETVLAKQHQHLILLGEERRNLLNQQAAEALQQEQLLEKLAQNLQALTAMQVEISK